MPGRMGLINISKYQDNLTAGNNTSFTGGNFWSAAAG